MKSPNPIAEQAAIWDARLRAPDCSDRDRAEFATWRDAHVEHRQTFEKLQLIVASLRNNMARADIRSLRDSALQSGQGRKRIVAAAAVVATFAVTATLWTLLSEDPTGAAARGASAPSSVRTIAGSSGPGQYETGIGETSTLTLQDGSTVTLNARTRIRVAVSETAREVELVDGQAFFHVAKDPQRPFIVRAADRDITAIGTSFDVRLDATSVRVTLLEGKLKVSSESALPGRLPGLATAGSSDSIASSSRAADVARAGILIPEVFLAPGQQFLAHLPAPTDSIVREVDVSKVTGWRDGRVFLEDLTLAGAVAEMNRYSPVQINVIDADLAGIRINGMFRAGEQDAFVTALQDYFPISARRDGDLAIALTKRR